MGVVYFRVRKPGGSRKTFSVRKQETRQGAWETIQPEGLQEVNDALLKGQISLPQAEIQVNTLVAALYKKRDRERPKGIPNEDNKRILDAFLEDEYAHRELVDPYSAVRDYTRAIDAVGLVSLRSGTRVDIQKAVDRIKGINRQRRAVARLNTILAYLNRGFKLTKRKSANLAISYLTASEVGALISSLPSEYRLLFSAAFATGCRLGELFALTPADLRDKYVWVDKQINRKGLVAPTKNRKPHKAYIIPEYQDALVRWLEVDRREKLVVRDITWSRVARKYSEGRINFHDLRHSYAIHLLGVGVPLTHVAQSLGHSAQVCEMYYTGYVLTDLAIDTIDRIVNRRD